MSLGVWLLAWMSSFLIATGVLRGLGIIAPLTTGAMALFVAAVLVRWSLRPAPLAWLGSLLSVGLLGLASIALASLCRDISYDGPAIHLPSALEIVDGLNPATTRPGDVFTAIYPNGLWTLQAFFITLTSGLEEGKAPAWLLAFASMPLLAVALRSLRGAWTPAVVTAAVVVQLNPVLLLQLTSFELDGVVYSLAMSAVAGAVLLSTPHGRVGAVAVCAALLLLANTKITGLYWAGLIALAAVAQSTLEHRRPPIRLAVLLLVVMITAVVIVGWRPYVAVPLETGQLFGATTDVVLGPANMNDAGPLTRIAYLLFGISSNPVGAELARLKWPWMMHSSEFVSLLDIRIGGFGPGFGLQMLGALLVAGVAVLRMRRNLHQDNNWLAPFWIAVLSCATLAFPVSWWARLVSPFWLVAALALVVRNGGLAPSRHLVPLVWIGWALVLAGSMANGLATVATLRNVAMSNIGITQALAAVSQRGDAVRIVPGNPEQVDGTPLVWQQRLIRASIHPVVGPSEGCREPLFATGSVRLCVNRERP